MKLLLSSCALFGVACGAITNPAGPTFPPHGQQEPVDGFHYCQMISDSARVRASRTAVYGWSVSILGAGASVAGTALPLSKTGDLEFKHKFGSASLVAGGAILVLLGQAVLKRSDAASKLAGETVSVLGESEDKNGTQVRITADEAAAKCSKALGAWESARADATALATKLLEEKKADAKEAEAKATDANTKANKATKNLEQVRALLKKCGPGLKCSDQDMLDLQQTLGVP